MLSDDQRRKLTEDFFDDREFSSSLTTDEEKYIEYLTKRWAETNLQLYGSIMEADKEESIQHNK